MKAFLLIFALAVPASLFAEEPPCPHRQAHPEYNCPHQMHSDESTDCRHNCPLSKNHYGPHHPGRGALPLIGWGISLLVVGFGAYRILQEIRENREQRIKELQWKKSGTAKNLMDDFYADLECKHARIMLSHDEKRDYRLGEKHTYYDIKHLKAEKKDIIEALQAKEKYSDEERYIRECFDRLIFHFTRLEKYISRELIDFEDIQYPANLYVLYMNDHGTGQEYKTAITNYIEQFDIPYIIDFLNRFDEWTTVTAEKRYKVTIPEKSK